MNKLLKIDVEWDACVISGDFMPTMLQDGTNSGSRFDDYRYQGEYIKSNYPRLKRIFDGRPVMFCQGNHDWYENVLWEHDDNEIDLTYKTITLDGITYKGLSFVPLMRQWNNYYEGTKYEHLPVDVLVTHAPQIGILSRTKHDDHVGLNWIGEKRYHLFGHIHESFGVKIKNGILYSNASRGYNIIDVD